MSTAVSTKVMALGAAGSIIAQQATKVLDGLRGYVPTLRLEWPAGEVAEQTIEILQEAAQETAIVAEGVVTNTRMAFAFGLGMITTVTAVGAYRAYQRYGPMRGGRWIKGGRIPETRVAGSEEIPLKEPRFAVRLAWKNNRGEYIMTGWGYRVDYNGKPYLMTVQHGLTDESDTMYLRKGDQFFPIDVTGWIAVAVDAALVPVPENVFSRLQIQKPSIGLIPSIGTAVSVVGLEGKGTTGLLTNAKPGQGFGKVIYSATTMGGYSGSPYHSGRVVYGMHQTGGYYNMGYSSMYLHVKCKIATDDNSEDESPRTLDEWFDDDEEELPIEWEGDWAIIGHSSGKYLRIKKKDYYEAENRWKQRGEERRNADIEAEDQRRLQFEQQQQTESASIPCNPSPPQENIVLSIPLSGNGQSPGSSRGGQESVQHQPSGPENRRVSTTASQTSSHESRPPLKKLTRSQKLAARLAKQLIMPSQQERSVSTKPSMSTQKYAKKQ